jgi:ElaB/YqjD/DUF883 family membrane-anchored ribosome-binding protein
MKFSRTANSSHTRPTRNTMNDVQTARDKLIGDTRAVIADAEVLLRAAREQAGDRLDALRDRMEDNFDVARVSLARASEGPMEEAANAGRTANAFVYAYPWQAVGIAAGCGLLVGLLVSRR